MTTAVDRLTLVGYAELQRGNQEGSLRAFTSAHATAQKQQQQQHGDPTVAHTCAVNLFSAYISMHNSDQGIALLQTMLSTRGGISLPYGDVHYNLGLAYESTDEHPEAVRQFELAVTEYSRDPSARLLQTETYSKLGQLYAQLGSRSEAAESYGRAAAGYEALGDVERRVLCLLRQSAQLEADSRVDDAVAVADVCLTLCEQSSSLELQGRLYNELGLQYATYCCLEKAATCFRRALPLQKRKDKRGEAVVLQNIGAIYNCLQDFETSLQYHESAAKLHAQSGGRNAQGQCFNNMAFAYSQLGDLESARDHYLHALQAAKDTNDGQGKWQAYEGLAAVAYAQNKFDMALNNIKKALGALSTTDESDAEAQNRLVGKLSGILLRQIEYDRSAQSDNSQMRRSMVRNSQMQRGSVASSYRYGHSDGPASPIPDHSILDVERDASPEIDHEEFLTTSIKDTAAKPALENAVDGGESVAAEADEQLNEYRRQMERKDKATSSGSSSSGSSSDSSDSEAEFTIPASMPMLTAPRPPQRLPDGTYELPPSDNLPGISSTATKVASQPAEADSLYATIPVKGTLPPTLPVRNRPSSASRQKPSQAATNDKNSKHLAEGTKQNDRVIIDSGSNKTTTKKNSDEIELPTKQEKNDSKACLIM